MSYSFVFSCLWRLGLYYYNARWYDPNLGRFTTEDPIKDGNNWYIYAANNPLKFIDPTGLEFIDTDPSGRQQGDYYSQDHPNRFTNLGLSSLSLADAACNLAAFARIGNDLRAKQGLEPISLIESNKLAIGENLYSGKSKNLLTKDAGRLLVERMSGKIISEIDSVTTNIKNTARKYDSSEKEVYGILKTEFSFNNSDSTHFMNLDGYEGEDFLLNDTSRKGRKTSSDFRNGERPVRLDIYEVSGDGSISKNINTENNSKIENIPSDNKDIMK